MRVAKAQKYVLKCATYSPPTGSGTDSARGRTINQWFHGREADRVAGSLTAVTQSVSRNPTEARIMNVDLEVVTIPVFNVDKARGFYRDQLGWRLDSDINRDGFRIVQMTPRRRPHVDRVRPRHPPGGRTGLDHRDLPRPGAPFLPAARNASDPNRTSYTSYASFTDRDGNS